MTEPENAQVLPLLRVVAAGLRHEGTGRWLRLTLVATPAKAAGGFPLRDWPSEMQRRVAGSLTVFLRAAPPAGPVADLPEPLRLKATARAPAQPKLAAADAAAANRLWRAALEVSGPASWPLLADDIDRSLSARKHRGDLSRTLIAKPGESPVKFEGDDAAIVVPPPKPTDTAVVRGVVPVAQTALASEAETVRAARVFALMQCGPYTLDKPNRALPTRDPIPKNCLNTARQELYGEAKQAVEPARQRSRDVFEDTRQTLFGSLKASGPVNGTALIPLPGLVRDGRPGCANEASHAYGSWLQATPAPPPAPEPKQGESQQEQKDRLELQKQQDQELRHQKEQQELHARFYALQGDPLLSRLFRLCVDVEVPLDPARVKDGYMHLRAALDGVPAPDGRPEVWTAARLRGDRFWPCSMFEPGAVVSAGPNLVSTGNPAAVGQADGVWCMAGPGTAERFELASLDVRGATEGARARPGPRAGSAGDRGEQHRTAGFTILDRHRADEVARTLAVSENQAAAAQGGPVVLHAEELTIGRRVDIASVAAGEPAGGVGARWRNLMGRMVRLRFPHHGDAEHALARLVPPPGTDEPWPEDGSFQAGARLLPQAETLANAGHVSYEAVVDEAVFTWDGTPAGALTDAGPKSGQASATLPWERTQRPRLERDGKGRLPPPLRYGVPYLFGLTSVFLGGVAPSIETVRAVRAERSTSMLPTAAVPPAGGPPLVRPRRFLRQEGVGAPLLMFTRDTALARHGEGGVMGYEALTAAILRTANGKAPLRNVPSARARAAPETTQRVFLPPELTLDAVARHGMLDVPDPARVLRGGLRNVQFLPRRNKEGDRTVQGFPTIVNTSRPDLNGQPLTVRREVGPGLGQEGGMPLFDPGRNGAEGNEPGFLPDPAAQFYCVRARVSGSDAYLGGAIELPVFPQGHPYPDARPLVLQLHKRGDTRTAPARDIAELRRRPERHAWMVTGGGLAAGGGGGRQHVWVLELELAPDEEFDLEVTCLPSMVALARWFSVVETMAAQWRAASNDEDGRKRLECLAGPLPPLPAADGPAFGTICAGSVDAAAIEATAARLSQAMRKDWQIGDIATAAGLQITHAVNIPTTAPALSNLRARRPGLPRRDNWTISDVPGSATVLLEGQLSLDLDQVGGVELMAWLVPDARDIDSPARSRSQMMRRSGRWPQTVDDKGSPVDEDVKAVVGFYVAEDGRVTLPTDRVHLLQVDNLPAHHAVRLGNLFKQQEGRLTTLDLGMLYKAALQGRPVYEPVGAPPGQKDGVPRQRPVRAVLNHALTGPQARRLVLEVVTVGRHAPTFETEPRFVRSGTPLYQRRMPLDGADQSRIWFGPPPGWVVHVQASKRPRSPMALRPELSFQFGQGATLAGAGQDRKADRVARVRLWLRRNWCSSGEGERLGIVLWPPFYRTAVVDENGERKPEDRERVEFNGRRFGIPQLEDADLGPGGAFISRWGGDPIRGEASPQHGMLIPPAAFSFEAGAPHDPRWVDVATMPDQAGGPDEDKDEADLGSLPVSLLTLEPYFDLDREQWFVDVPLEPIRATEPFVRFGLVRYQENAPAALRVSRPVVVFAAMLPKRTVRPSVTWTGDDVAVLVEVVGGGSLGAEMPDWRKVEPLVTEEQRMDWARAAAAAMNEAARPVMLFTIMHERKDEAGRLHRVEVHITERDVTRGEVNQQLQWKLSATIRRAEQKRYGRGLYVCFVEEVDRRMPATYPTEPIKPPDMFSVAGKVEQCSLVDSGPRFSMRVELFEILDLQ